MNPMFFAKAKGKVGELYVYQEIGEGWFGGISAQSFADALKEVGAVDTLNVYVNSPGGNVFDGITIYNQLKRFSAKKIIHVDALAASIASVICMAGDEIVMAPNAQMMIHDPWGMCVGTADEMRKSADTLDQVRTTLLDTYEARTKAPRADISEWMAAETWMTAKQAMERGFADRIDEDTEDAQAYASPILAKFKNTPANLLQKAKDARVLIASMSMHANKIRAASRANA